MPNREFTWYDIPAGAKPTECRGEGCGATIYFIPSPKTPGKSIPISMVPDDAPTTTLPGPSWQPVPRDARVLWFPWAFVMHDNHRLQPAKGRKGLIATSEYRDKKAEAATLAALQWGPAPKLHGDISLTARCYFPDKRKRDAGNYRKLITDALTGTVYADDSALISETWRRAGIVARAEARIEVLVYAGQVTARRECPDCCADEISEHHARNCPALIGNRYDGNDFDDYYDGPPPVPTSTTTTPEPPPR